ncbi:MAG: hypothetical protein ACYTFZ_08935 [Planctomycetota bacterium]|jgi:hypothetical protein
MTAKPAKGHWSFDPILECLEAVVPPQGEFDPTGEWEHTYDVLPIYGSYSKSSEEHKGELCLKRQPLPDGGFRLSVESVVKFIDWGHHPTKTQRTTAEIRCAADALATPLQWQLESAAIGAEGKPHALSKMKESGALRDGTVELSVPGGTRAIKVAEGMTSNWTLFDAVQRLSGGAPPAGGFDMLEDLRLLRVGQALRLDGAVEVRMGGQAAGLHGYRQIGEGILPIHYWLDDQERLLFALGGVRAYVWRGQGTRAAE